jgi:hypothetical protein
MRGPRHGSSKTGWRKHVLVLAVDPFGIKPLYYAQLH